MTSPRESSPPAANPTGPPRARTELVGRARDLAAIRDALQSGARLVSVVGAMGVGKTAVALEHAIVAHAAGAKVAYCEFAAATSIGELCASVARAIGITLSAERSDDEAVARIGRALGSYEAICLVMDNLEHLVELAPRTISRWLDSAPGVTVLVTSRVRLRLRGEQVVELRPLAVPLPDARDLTTIAAVDGVRLFMERSALVQAGCALSQANAADVAAIVRRLDGIPLAIELCAARMSVLSPRGLLEQLGSALDVLARAPRDSSDRQSSLRRTLEWSWSLLAPWEQRAMAWCSVFRGGWTLEALERLLPADARAESGSALDTLQALHEQSLITTTRDAQNPDAVRYSMYETVREFASEQLRALGLESAARDRLVAVFVPDEPSLLRALEAGTRAHPFMRFAVDTDNLFAAFERAVAISTDPAAGLRAALVLSLVLEPTGPTPLILRALERAIAAHSPSGSERLRAWALFRYAAALRTVGRLDECCTVLDDAILVAERSGDSAAQIRALVLLAEQRSNTAGLEPARDTLARAKRIISPAHSPALHASISRAEGVITWNGGRREDVQQHFARALGLYERAGDRNDVCAARVALGNLYQLTGDIERSRVLLEAAAADAMELGLSSLAARTLGDLGCVRFELGDIDAARESFAEAFALHRRVGSWGDAAWHHCYLAAFEAATNAASVATDHIVAAFEYLKAEGAFAYPAMVLLALSGSPAADAWLDAFDSSRESEHENKAVAEFAGIRQAYRSLQAASGALAQDQFEAVGAALARVRAVLAEEDARDGERTCAYVFEARLAIRLVRRDADTLSKELKDALASRGSSPRMLYVDKEGRWFRIDDGESIDVSRSRSAQYLLAHFATWHRTHRGSALGAHDLFEAGWPGERARPDAAANRVYVALNRLRGLGLRDVLIRKGDGWLFDPAWVVESA